MVRVKLKDGYFWVESMKIPPLCGEFHFWRNNVLHWNRILNSIKDLGFKHIACYVEWEFHRITPDGTPIEKIEYDFEGKTNPQRDLVGFLKIVKESGLWLNLRPGPYIYAETEFGGPPKEAAKYHRNHPKFLDLATHYLNHVLPAIKTFLVTNGGPIFMVQLDNEVSMIMYPEQVMDGSVEELGSFRSFIKEKYGSPEIAGKKFGFEWESWDDVEPCISAENAKEFLAYLDTAEFLERYTALYFRRISEIFKRNGIDVPFYINSTGPPFPHNPDMLKDIVDLRTADIYYLKKERLIGMLTLNAKYLKATNPLVMNGEFRSGGMECSVPPKEYLYQALLWMGYGFHGVNYFMLVERHRWPNTPIDWVGRPMNDELYKTFKKICEIYNTLKPNEFINHSIAEIGLLWYRPHLYVEKDSITEPGYHTEPKHGFNQIFNSLIYGNIMFEIVYPNFNYVSPDSLKYIFVAGQNFMDPETALYLSNYIDNGGHLIFYNSFPTKTLENQPLNLFSDYLYKPESIIKLGSRALAYFHSHLNNKTMSLSLDSEFVADFNVQVDSNMNKNLENTITMRNLTIGYTIRKNKGKITVLGFELNEKSISPMLSLLGFQNPIKLANPDILATVYHNKDSDEIMLTLININYEKPQKLSFALDTELLGLKQSKFKIQQFVSPKIYEIEYLKFDNFGLNAQSGEILKISKI